MNIGLAPSPRSPRPLRFVEFLDAPSPAVGGRRPRGRSHAHRTDAERRVRVSDDASGRDASGAPSGVGNPAPGNSVPHSAWLQIAPLADTHWTPTTLLSTYMTAQPVLPDATGRDRTVIATLEAGA